MKKNLMKIFALMMALAFVLGFAGCGSSDGANEQAESAKEAAEDVEDLDDADEADDTDELPGGEYGCFSTDPVELAIYEYLADEIGENFDDSDVCIPVVHVFNVDDADSKDIKVYGDYWIYNYDIEGDTLKCVSGGDFPGCMHVAPKDDNEFEVTSFDAVEDGSNYESSAKEIFGDSYEDFTAYEGNQDAKDEDRYNAVTAYVNYNGIPCTKFQDEGGDPIDLHL